MLALMFVLLVAYCSLRDSSTPSGGGAATISEAPVSADVTRAQFEAVAGARVSGGSGQVRVEPFDRSVPNTTRIIISRGDVPPYAARKIAGAARDRLGARAIVYVGDDTRKTLAKAAPWGME